MSLHPRLTAMILGSALLAGFWIAGFPVPSTEAQIPDTFNNLQVLPQDIGKRDLIGVMKNFAAATGLRCTGCHVAGPDPQTLDGVDFVSDKPSNKQVAREMMKMVSAINGEYIAHMGMKSPTQVRCITCHRGVEEPETLDDLLLGVARKDGATAAQERYRELRTGYYGSGAYDFGFGTLSTVAEGLFQDGDPESAAAMARLNVEMFPENDMAYAWLGQILSMQGKTDDAVKNLERAMELAPDNPRYKSMLEQIRAKN